MIELVPAGVRTALMGQQDNEDAMPLEDFLTETMDLLAARPAPRRSSSKAPGSSATPKPTATTTMSWPCSPAPEPDADTNADRSDGSQRKGPRATCRGREKLLRRGARPSAVLRLIPKTTSSEEGSMEKQVINPWSWQDRFGLVQAIKVNRCRAGPLLLRPDLRR